MWRRASATAWRTRGSAARRQRPILARPSASPTQQTSGGAGSFSTVAYDATSTLIRYTLAGDANLDRSVNSIDFTQLVAGFGTTAASATPARWFTGDFNYDGVVDTRDFAALIGNFAAALPGIAPGELPAGPGALVPEPAAVSLLAIGSLLLRRRAKK